MSIIELTPENIIANELQQIHDLINGGLTNRNMKTFRTFFVVSAQDSLDSTYPFLMPFNIPSGMTNLVSAKVSFWLQPFRAYAKSASSGGGSTSGSGGAQTSSSGGAQTVTSAAGGGQTSTANNDDHYHTVAVNNSTSGNAILLSGGNQPVCSGGGTIYTSVESRSHTHTVANHQHSVTVANHTHTVADHTHSTPDHTHTITFGIYETNTSPSITLSVSRDGGATYVQVVGTYSTNQIGIEITSLVDTVGAKMLKFESTNLGRLSVQIEIKLDMSKQVKR